MSELDDLYDGREQTLVKHRVLRLYLTRHHRGIEVFKEPEKKATEPNQVTVALARLKKVVCELTEEIDGKCILR